MKLKEIVERVQKINKMLRELNQEQKKVDLIVYNTSYQITTFRELKKMLDENYVKEFVNTILEADFDTNYSVSGSAKYKTFEGKPSEEWTSTYNIMIDFHQKEVR